MLKGENETFLLNLKLEVINKVVLRLYIFDLIKNNILILPIKNTSETIKKHINIVLDFLKSNNIRF